MKVIKKGSYNNAFPMKIICHPDYSGVDYGVVCPVCGKFVVVDISKIPIQVLNGAKEISVS